MTEITEPGRPRGRQQPPDGIVAGADELLVDATVSAGLELKIRSQWSYARMRFLRHRLAMAGLVGL